MLTAYKQKVTVKSGGWVSLRSNKLKPGTQAEMIVLVEAAESSAQKFMTGADLLKSGLVGIWADRQDLGDSLAFARALREKSEQRGRSA
jgi:hypothetical protein